MMKLRKIAALVLVACMALSLASCGCSNGADGLSICLASEPETLDPGLNSSLDGATMIIHLFSGLTKWDQDGKTILPDCAVEIPEGVVNEDGTVTYTYTLKDDLKWSDGQALTAGDFEFAWKRTANDSFGAEYGYMFDVIKGYPNDLAVEATDDKTLVVTLNNAVSYWNELLAFPTYMPVREDVVADEKWSAEAETYICNGAYTISSWKHNQLITLTKNENYHEADKVTMPQINCYLSDDNNAMLANYKSGNWQMIDNVPAGEISNLKENNPDEFKTIGQLGTYYICWNVNENVLPATSKLTGVEREKAQAEIRQALMLVLDRNHIVENISKSGEVPASSFVSLGLTDYDGSEFYKNAGPSDEYAGYYDVDAIEENFAQAVEVLKKYYAWDEATQTFTDGPKFTYLYNTDTVHEAIATYVQSAFAAVGVKIELANVEWNTFLDQRHKGDFSVTRHGWVADYNDPITFLDLWISTSGNNDAQLGKGEHASVKAYSIDLTPYGYDIVVNNGTWAQTYDVLISTIKSCTDSETRYALMHYAEDMLMSTGVVCPIYYYTDLFMLNPSVKGFYTNPLGYKYFMYTTID